MSNKFLVVVDMQNDFIDGSLGSEQARAIVQNVIKLTDEFENIIFTKDAHDKNYLTTLEGKKLPVPHCLAGSEGYKIQSTLYSYVNDFKNERGITVVEVSKHTFGSFAIKDAIMDNLKSFNDLEIHICGLLTDICVISNALILKNQFPNAEIYIHKDCCAGSSVEKHNAALAIADSCQINVI